MSMTGNTCTWYTPSRDCSQTICSFFCLRCDLFCCCTALVGTFFCDSTNQEISIRTKRSRVRPHTGLTLVRVPSHLWEQPRICRLGDGYTETSSFQNPRLCSGVTWEGRGEDRGTGCLEAPRDTCFPTECPNLLHKTSDVNICCGFIAKTNMTDSSIKGVKHSMYILDHLLKISESA